MRKRREKPDPSVSSPPSQGLGSGDLAHALELDEFFQALGPVMRLSPKDEEEPKKKPVAEATGKAGSKRRKALVLAALLLLTGAAFQAPLTGLLTRDGPVPDEFLGNWETVSRRYADRGFAITSDTLRIRLGPSGIASYPITGFRATRTADSVLYTIHYQDGSALMELGLRVEADSTLRLAHLPGVFWQKESR
jgi:hypothetical protein